MATELDPRGAEPEALLAAADFSARRVLEIGAGDGRLTYRFVAAARFAAAVDLDVGKVASANAARPAAIRPRLTFLPASAVALPFRCCAFDVVLLAWSL